MSKAYSAIIMLTLMLLTSTVSISPPIKVEESESLPLIEYTMIESDPDSVRSLDNSVLIEGIENWRETTASTRLGIFDEAGLRLNREIPESLSLPRFDVVMVLVNGEVALWDAQEEIKTIRGVEIRAHIPPSGFFVQADASAISALKLLPSVVAIHQIPSAMFVADELLDNPETEELVRIEGWRSNNELGLVDEISLSQFTWAVSDIAKELIQSPIQLDIGRFDGWVSSDSLPLIAANPALSWIRLSPDFELHNDQSRNHMGVSSVVNAFATQLNGSGQIVAVADSGIDQDHGDMNGRINGVVSVVSGDSSTEDTHSGHGTHVACTVLGDGARGGYAGVAPEANLYFQAMERDSDGQFYSPSMNYLLNSAYDNGAHIHTNSWGAQTNFGQYTTDAVDVDDRTNFYDQYWSYDGLAVLFSAGNDGDGAGTITPPATAKNQIAVGNHHNRGGGAPDTMATGSSRGPTDDGRLKPDVSAPGSWVRSCRSQDASDIAGSSWSSTWYLEYSGTSMAAPNAAGASALIREYLMEIAQRPQPQGALVKSLLILGAEDMGTRNIPNNDEGWGRVNLRRSLATIGDTGVWVDDRNFLRSGNSRDYSFNLTHGWQQLKIVLSWSDYRGSTWATDQLQNDLDLIVTAPDGTTTYLGNVFQNGRSQTGGTADDVNNVEVVLIDQAQKGVWAVRVSDVRHGGQKSEQTYALAIRGAGVDDLSPDAAFVPNSFSLSDPIPQVNEEVTFSVVVTNMGSRVMDDLAVRASAAGQMLGTQTISLGPGEVRGLNWQWTPTTNGDNSVIIEVDPTDAFDELDESNNIYLETVGVTEPGVRLTTDSLIKRVSDSSSNTAQWNLTIRNTALIGTNATVSVEKPIRQSDGQQFSSWFQSFSQTTFELNGSQAIDFGLTMVHPAPPEPGIYQFVVTGTDVDNGIDYPITLTLDVPILPGFRFNNLNQMVVSPIENTTFDVTMFNEGNGPQGWDLTLNAPSGWHLGFDDLGSIAGTPSASSGYIPTDTSMTTSVSLIPPSETIVSAGTSMSGSIVAVSQLDNDLSWTLNLDFEVAGYRTGSIFNESSFGTLRPDSHLNLRFTILNEGNVDLEFSPTAELPGGWGVINQLPTMTLIPSESKSIVIAIQGNGVAAAGPIQIAMVDTSGYRIEWDGYLDVQTTPQPSISFDEIVLSDGSRSSSILALGDHPVGLPGFTLVWLVTNGGATAWTPTPQLLLPSSAWTGMCGTISEIAPGSGERIECLVVLPPTLPAGEEPAVSMKMTIDDVSIVDTVTLKVASTKQVIWDEFVQPESFVEGQKAEFSLDIVNEGNTPLSHRVSVVGPDDWDVTITNTEMVELSAGEARTLIFSVVADSPGQGVVIFSLESASGVEGSVHSIELSAADDPNRAVAGSASGIITIIGILVFVLLLAGGGFVLVTTRKKDRSLFNTAPQVPMMPDMPPPPGSGAFSTSSSGAASSTTMAMPPPPSHSGNSAPTMETSVAQMPPPPSSGKYPMPPPPTAGEMPPPPPPAASPASAAFDMAAAVVSSEKSESIEPTNDELTDEEENQPSLGEVSAAVVQPVEVASTSEEGMISSTKSESSVREISDVGREPSETEEADSNHKCWVCLGSLPPKGWQACPSCGARYHLSTSSCGVSNLTGCRNCQSDVGNFVKVE